MRRSGSGRGARGGRRGKCGPAVPLVSGRVLGELPDSRRRVRRELTGRQVSMSVISLAEFLDVRPPCSVCELAVVGEGIWRHPALVVAVQEHDCLVLSGLERGALAFVEGSR
jgi:hypothetical protein